MPIRFWLLLCVLSLFVVESPAFGAKKKKDRSEKTEQTEREVADEMPGADDAKTERTEATEKPAEGSIDAPKTEPSEKVEPDQLKTEEDKYRTARSEKVRNRQREKEEEQKRAENVSGAFMLGASAGTAYSNYHADIHIAANPKLSVGIHPSYGSKKPEGGPTTTMYGGILTVNFFSQPGLKGVWVQTGSGVLFLQANGDAGAESSVSPAAIFLLGYKDKWANIFQISLAGGFMYVTAPQRPTIELGFSTTQPMITGSIGMNF